MSEPMSENASHIRHISALPRIMIFCALLTVCFIAGNRDPLVVKAGLAVHGSDSTLYVLAVGINEYPAIKEMKLNYATPDAESIGSLFAGKEVKQAFQDVKVITLLDSDATLEKLRAAFAQIAITAKPQDVILFDFSGQEIGRRQREALGLKLDDYQFVLSDSSLVTKPEPAIANMLSAHELSTLLLSIQAQRQIVILDTCFSSEAFESIQKALNADSIFTLHEMGRRFALFGIEGDEFEVPSIKHGLMTKVLLDGMAGAADANRDGIITEGELEGFAMAYLPALMSSVQLVSYSDLRGLCLSVKNQTPSCDGSYGYDPQIKPQAPTPTRGLIAEEEPDTAKPSSIGTDYALIFAGDSYDHWPKLGNPIYDAQTLSKELIANFGYKPDNVVIVENPTKKTVFDKLAEFRQRAVSPNDRLLIYFAGHGYMDSDEGFVVTRETQLPADDRYMDSALALSRLRDIVDKLPVQHILIVLDVCYGGVFKERKTLPAYNVETLDTPQPVEAIVGNKMKSISRLYIASGGLRQAFDGEPGRHSPFARTFLKTLRQYGGQEHLIDMGKLDGAVYGLCPHPYSGTFGIHQDEGDFVFIPRPNPEKVQDSGLDAPTPAPHCSI